MVGSFYPEDARRALANICLHFVAPTHQSLFCMAPTSRGEHCQAHLYPESEGDRTERKLRPRPEMFRMGSPDQVQVLCPPPLSLVSHVLAGAALVGPCWSGFDGLLCQSSPHGGSGDGRLPALFLMCSYCCRISELPAVALHLRYAMYTHIYIYIYIYIYVRDACTVPVAIINDASKV